MFCRFLENVDKLTIFNEMSIDNRAENGYDKKV